jgi:DNA-binding GntR family transcriptional regulator
MSCVTSSRRPEPSYRQLASQLRAMIESGAIGPHEALPSITYMVQETARASPPVFRRAAMIMVFWSL